MIGIWRFEFVFGDFEKLVRILEEDDVIFVCMKGYVDNGGGAVGVFWMIVRDAYFGIGREGRWSICDGVGVPL